MRQWTVDAFASEPFRGNGACVVEPFGTWPQTAWMQSLAAENNQAETAYLLKTPDPARFGLRWFTPLLEVPLCGHATLAAGHVLLSELAVKAVLVTFDTHSGPLTLCRMAGGYEMDFPAQPPVRIDPPVGLAEALGATPDEVWLAPYLVAIFGHEDIVRGLKPDLVALNALASAATAGRGNVGVAALATPGSGVDVVDRFFAPGSGIPEDPATGSLHCILSPLFAQKLGRPVVTFLQAYPGRGGDITCELRGERVLLRGQAAPELGVYLAIVARAVVIVAALAANLVLEAIKAAFEIGTLPARQATLAIPHLQISDLAELFAQTTGFAMAQSAVAQTAVDAPIQALLALVDALMDPTVVAVISARFLIISALIIAALVITVLLVAAVILAVVTIAVTLCRRRRDHSCRRDGRREGSKYSPGRNGIHFGSSDPWSAEEPTFNVSEITTAPVTAT